MNKYKNIQNSVEEIMNWFRSELKSISAGVASPAMLDSVNVESYGSYMPLTHVANINIEDAKTLKITPFDKSQNKAIEQAIRNADLGLSLIADGECVRAISPQLTTETRSKYVKIAKTKLEDARIKVRSIRQEIMEEIEEAKKSGELGEDDRNKKKEEVQKIVDSTNQSLDALFDLKEEAIMKI